MSIIKVYYDKEQIRLKNLLKELLKKKNKQFLIDIAYGKVLAIFEYKEFKEKRVQAGGKLIKKKLKAKYKKLKEVVKCKT